MPPQDQDLERADRDVRVIGRELEKLSHCPSASLMILGQPWLSQPCLEQRKSKLQSLSAEKSGCSKANAVSKEMGKFEVTWFWKNTIVHVFWRGCGNS